MSFRNWVGSSVSGYLDGLEALRRKRRRGAGVRRRFGELGDLGWPKGPVFAPESDVDELKQKCKSEGGSPAVFRKDSKGKKYPQPNIVCFFHKTRKKSTKGTAKQRAHGKKIARMLKRKNGKFVSRKR